MPVLRFPTWVDRADLALDRPFDRVRGRPSADWVFYTASELGNHSLLWHLLGAARGLRSDRDLAAAVRLSVCLGVESALVNGLFKSLVKRDRPVWEELRPRNLRRPRTSSFPSGHASSGFFAAGLLSEGDRLAPVYYTLATVVAASRVFTRVHHPSDVLAGAALGAVMAREARKRWPLPEESSGPATS